MSKKRFTLAELQELPDELWPRRVGRYSIRTSKNESLEDFKERVFSLYEQGRIKDPQPKGPTKNFLSDLDQEFVEEFRENVESILQQESPCYEALAEKFGEGDIIQMLAQAGVVNDRLRFLSTPRHDKRAKTPRGLMEGNLQHLRVGMMTWVENTKTVKACEASCNLDCLTCPSPQILSCASDNLTPAEDDGFDLFSLLSDPTYAD